MIVSCLRGNFVLKLYRLTDDKKEYWETWDNGNGSHTVHWGELGTEGDTKEVKSKNAHTIIQKEIDEIVHHGFRPAEHEHALLIEYSIDGMGTAQDADKQHRLEDRMNNTLGWNGLGHCDGGSIGSGTMEVCNFVVDYNLAKAVIESDLKGTEFENYTRIYCED